MHTHACRVHTHSHSASLSAGSGYTAHLVLQPGPCLLRVPASVCPHVPTSLCPCQSGVVSEVAAQGLISSSLGSLATLLF